MGESAVPDDSVLRRVVVLGTSGAGKTTLARRLAAWSGGEYVELDGLYHGPGWTPTPVEEFRKAVAEVAEHPKWIVDGNYISKLADVLWHRADTFVWLDLPLPVILVRLVRRTVSRIIRRTELWNGNREEWRSFLSRDSLILWAIKMHRRHRRDLPLLLAPPQLTNVSVVRLRSTAEANRWLAGVCAS